MTGSEGRNSFEQATADIVGRGYDQPKCRVRAATLYERLAALTATGRIVKAGNGSYRLVGA
jgi:hypothetical protein